MSSAQRETLLTTSAVARDADCSETIARKVSNLIPHQRLPDGRRLFGPEAIEAIVALRAKSSRGRQRR